MLTAVFSFCGFQGVPVSQPGTPAAGAFNLKKGLAVREARRQRDFGKTIFV